MSFSFREFEDVENQKYLLPLNGHKKLYRYGKKKKHYFLLHFFLHGHDCEKCIVRQLMLRLIYHNMSRKDFFYHVSKWARAGFYFFVPSVSVYYAVWFIRFTWTTILSWISQFSGAKMWLNQLFYTLFTVMYHKVLHLADTILLKLSLTQLLYSTFSK